MALYKLNSAREGADLHGGSSMQRRKRDGRVPPYPVHDIAVNRVSGSFCFPLRRSSFIRCGPLFACAFLFTFMGITKMQKITEYVIGSNQSEKEYYNHDANQVKDIGIAETGNVSESASIASQPKTNNISTQQPLPITTVFYNIYLPPADLVYNETVQLGDATNALRILREQLNQIGNAEPFRKVDPVTGKKPVHIFYTTVGDSSYLNETYMNYLCWERNHMTCKHLRHYGEAFEDATLQPLYDFCTANDNSAARRRVVYLHSKGTYHHYKKGQNDRWRYFLTYAATSRSCLQHPTLSSARDKPQNPLCNVCGLQFWPVWGVFFPGNMWAADCSYVAKLVSPRDLPSAFQKVEAAFTKLLDEQRILPTLYNSSFSKGQVDVPWLKTSEMKEKEKEKLVMTSESNALTATSTDKNSVAATEYRYIWEYWIASHPDLHPCDMSLTPDLFQYIRMGIDRKQKVQTLQIRQAPRNKLKEYKLRRREAEAGAVLTTKSLRVRDYFLLPGNIVKWQTLYNTLPPSSSWAWSWYPDGKQWQKALAEHGSQALKVITDGNPLESSRLQK